jgi:phytol kinase
MIFSIFAILAELAFLTCLMAGLQLLSRRYPLSPESLRKLFHVGGGLTTLAFPWIFPSYEPVVVLALVTIPALLTLKYVRGLRVSFGSVLYGIQRVSFGEVFFPLSICLLFVLAGHNALLYSIPVLTLTFADTAAAVAGKHFGRLRYPAPGGHKSLEGSAAFFVTACICALAPLTLADRGAPLSALFIAITLSLLLTVVEAISFGGLDNLLIPLLGYLFLRTLLVSDLSALWLDVEIACGAMVVATMIFDARRSPGRSSAKEQFHV